ncbi:MAG TPA: hypothetical protein VFL86_12805 [Burkholderiaceae bacterium]|nr:hypothetical protein [Burkholderiaceae bacterium]
MTELAMFVEMPAVKLFVNTIMHTPTAIAITVDSERRRLRRILPQAICKKIIEFPEVTFHLQAAPDRGAPLRLAQAQGQAASKAAIVDQSLVYAHSFGSFV